MRLGEGHEEVTRLPDVLQPLLLVLQEAVDDHVQEQNLLDRFVSKLSECFSLKLLLYYTEVCLKLPS